MLVRFALALAIASVPLPATLQPPSSAPATPTAATTRAAVLVGADQFRNLPDDALPSARATTERLRAALVAHAGFAPGAIDTLLGDRVHDREVRAAILAAARKVQASDDGLLLVAWTGLGWVRPTAGDPRGAARHEQMLVTTYSERQDGAFTDGIAVAQLAAWLGEARAEAGKRGVHLEPVLVIDACRAGRGEPPPKADAVAFAGWVAYGARHGQMAAAGQGGERFVFTTTLVDKLKEFAARGGSATLDAVFWSAREVILQQSGRAQDPDLVAPSDPALLRAGAPVLVIAGGASAGAGTEAVGSASRLPAGWACEVLDATPGSSTAYPRRVKDEKSGIVFLLVEPGEFQMGSHKGDGDEEPVHPVRITRPFYLAATETTQAQWEAVMGNNPSEFQGARLPVDSASWDDAQLFVRKLNGRDDGPFRLPTEAEWEYACRAGSTTEYAFGDVISTEQANYDGNRTWGEGRRGTNRERPVEAASLPANAWGFHEMHGNVWEWCQDWFDSDYYKVCRDGVVDPKGPASGSAHLARGGSWCSNPVYLRSSYRLDTSFQINRLYTGFRVARSL